MVLDLSLSKVLTIGQNMSVGAFNPNSFLPSCKTTFDKVAHNFFSFRQFL